MKKGELKIEKNVPIPARRSGYATVLRKLKPGESVFLPLRAVIAGNNAKYALGRGNYACRAEGDGARVWRIK